MIDKSSGKYKRYEELRKRHSDLLDQIKKEYSDEVDAEIDNVREELIKLRKELGIVVPKMKSVNELIMIEINRVKEYKDEYKNNPLFHEIIDGIINYNNPVEAIVNALYSYNQMLTNITSVIAQNADDESVNKVIENLQNQLKENNE